MNLHENDVIFTKDSLNKFIKLIKTEGIKNLNYYMMSPDIQVQNSIGDEFSLSEKTIFNGSIGIVNKSYYWANPYIQKPADLNISTTNPEQMTEADILKTEFKNVLEYNLYNFFNFHKNDNSTLSITMTNNNNDQSQKLNINIPLDIKNDYHLTSETVFNDNKEKLNFKYNLNQSIIDSELLLKKYLLLSYDEDTKRYSFLNEDKQNNDLINQQNINNYTKDLGSIDINSSITSNENALYYQTLVSTTYAFSSAAPNQVVFCSGSSQDEAASWDNTMFNGGENDPLLKALKEEIVPMVEENTFSQTQDSNFYDMFFASTADHLLENIKISKGYASTGGKEASQSSYALLYNKIIPVRSMKFRSWEPLKLVDTVKTYPNIENNTKSYPKVNNVNTAITGQWQPMDLVNLYGQYQMMKIKDQDLSLQDTQHTMAFGEFTENNELNEEINNNIHKIAFSPDFGRDIKATTGIYASSTTNDNTNQFEYIALDSIMSAQVNIRDINILGENDFTTATSVNTSTSYKSLYKDESNNYQYINLTSFDTLFPSTSSTLVTYNKISNNKIILPKSSSNSGSIVHSLIYKANIKDIILEFKDDDNSTTILTDLTFNSFKCKSNSKTDSVSINIDTNIIFQMSSNNKKTSNQIPIYILPMPAINSLFTETANVLTEESGLYGKAPSFLTQNCYGIFMQQQYDNIIKATEFNSSETYYKDQFATQIADQNEVANGNIADYYYKKEDTSYHLIAYYPQKNFWETGILNNNVDSWKNLIQDRFNNAVNNYDPTYTALNQDLNIFDIVLSSSTKTDGTALDVGSNGFYDCDLGFYVKDAINKDIQGTFELEYYPNVIDTDTQTHLSDYQELNVRLDDLSWYTTNHIPHNDIDENSTNSTIINNVYTSSYTVATEADRTKWADMLYGSQGTTNTTQSTISQADLFLYTLNSDAQNIADNTYEELSLMNQQLIFEISPDLHIHNTTYLLNDILAENLYGKSYFSPTNNDTLIEEDFSLNPKTLNIVNKENDEFYIQFYTPIIDELYTYLPNTYYIRDSLFNYNLAEGEYNPNTTYYEKVGETYIEIKQFYQPGTYYYYDFNENAFVLDYNETFRDNTVYYKGSDGSDYSFKFINKDLGTIQRLSQEPQHILEYWQNIQNQYHRCSQLISIQYDKDNKEWKEEDTESENQENIVYIYYDGENFQVIDNLSDISFINKEIQETVVLKLPYQYKKIPSNLINIFTETIGDSSHSDIVSIIISFCCPVYFKRNKYTYNEYFSPVSPLTILDPSITYYKKEYYNSNFSINNGSIDDLIKQEILKIYFNSIVFNTNSYYLWDYSDIPGQECDGNFTVNMFVNRSVFPENSDVYWVYNNKRISNIIFRVSTKVTNDIKRMITTQFDFMTFTQAEKIFKLKSYPTTKRYQYFTAEYSMSITDDSRTLVLVDHVTHNVTTKILASKNADSNVPTLYIPRKLLNRRNKFSTTYTTNKNYLYNQGDVKLTDQAFADWTSRCPYVAGNYLRARTINIFDYEKQWSMLHTTSGENIITTRSATSTRQRVIKDTNVSREYPITIAPTNDTQVTTYTRNTLTKIASDFSYNTNLWFNTNNIACNIYTTSDLPITVSDLDIENTSFIDQDAFVLIRGCRTKGAQSTGKLSYLYLSPEREGSNIVYPIYAITYTNSEITDIFISEQCMTCAKNFNTNQYVYSYNDSNPLSYKKNPFKFKGTKKIKLAWYEAMNRWERNPYPGGQLVFFKDWCKAGKKLTSTYNGKETASRNYYYYTVKLFDKLTISKNETFYDYPYNFSITDNNGTPIFTDSQEKKDKYLITYSLVEKDLPTISSEDKGFRLKDNDILDIPTFINRLKILFSTETKEKYYSLELLEDQTLTINDQASTFNSNNQIGPNYQLQFWINKNEAKYTQAEYVLAKDENSMEPLDINITYKDWELNDNNNDDNKIHTIINYNTSYVKGNEEYPLFKQSNNNYQEYIYQKEQLFDIPSNIQTEYPIQISYDSTKKIYIEDFRKNYNFRHIFLPIPNKTYTKSFTENNPFPNKNYSLDPNGCLIGSDGKDKSPNGTFSISSGSLAPGVLVQIRGFNDNGEYEGDLNGSTLNNVKIGDGILHVTDQTEAYRKPMIDVINATLKVKPEKAGGNLYASIVTEGGISAAKKIKGERLYGAIWNDYAEYRETDNIEAGRCVIETGTGRLKLSNERLQGGANIVSDTFGMGVGETEKAKTPIAVSGRALAYPYEDRDTFKPGDAVCSGPNGTISLMTREEIREWPDRIVGYVSEIPHYQTWGTGKVQVNNRIWIKIH